jgi:hypothetical protein
MAPEAPVKELGNVLKRMLQFMHEVPAEEEIHFAKVDLADGYWRMIVEESSRYNFTYVLPGPPDVPIQLVILSALQMGWEESPAYFCAATRKPPVTSHRRGSTRRPSCLRTLWNPSQ